ncbi:MAG: hypothetical protein IIZ51_11825, partial [Lachnospiraceae bacterium]|nr:hypothetical protein [Lachnospiraceae bacterium]
MTFVTEHGTAPEPVEVPDEGTIEQALNGSVDELYLPETDGYIFQYWAAPEGEAFGFDTPITSDLELHAVWGDGYEFNTGLEVGSPKIYIGEPVGTYDLGSDSFGGGVHTEVNASETEVYEAGTEYTVRVRFVTDPSYYFPNGGNIPLSVIETTPEWSTYMVSPVDYGRTYAEYEFTLVPVEREEISEIGFGEIMAYEGAQIGDVASLTWSSMGVHSFDIREETYEAGREYMLTMHITPNWGMVFANGGDIPVYCDNALLDKVSYNANEIVVQVPVTALSLERLDHIDLTFSAAAGDEVGGPYDFFTSNDAWCVYDHGFTDGTEVPQYFSSDAVYPMYVSVQAGTGIGFSDDVTVSVNGQAASVDREQSDVNRIYAVYEFAPAVPVTHEIRFVLPDGWPGAPDPVQVRHGMTLAQSACPQDQMAVE